MLDPVLRPLKDRALVPLARLAPRWINPAAVTLAGFAAGVSCVILLLLDHPGWALTLWFLNRLLDGYDGVLARTTGRQTDLGGYADIVLDLVVYASIPIALAVGSPAAGLPLAVLLASFYVNAGSWMYLAALLEKRAAGTADPTRPTSTAMPTGLIEGTETILFFTAFMLFPEHLTELFWTMSALVGVTVLQRTASALRHLGGGAAAPAPVVEPPRKSA